MTEREADVVLVHGESGTIKELVASEVIEGFDLFHLVTDVAIGLHWMPLLF